MERISRVAGVSACLMAAVLSTGCDGPAALPEPVRPVRAIKVGDLKAIGGREFPGRAKAKVEVDLSFRFHCQWT
jgi:hypothetical protein